MKDDNTINRRQFLKGSAAGLAVSAAPAFGKGILDQEKIPQVKYVTLGRTGVNVANIGYGTSRGSLDPSVMAYAMNKGINYFDCSEGYRRGRSEEMLGKAVKKFRDKVFITTKVGSVNAAGRLTAQTTKQEVLDRFYASLERLDMPYVEALFIHGAGDPDFGGFENAGVWSALEQLRSDGKVQYFGISTHNWNLVEAVKRAVASNKIDLMLLAYNYFQRNLPKGRERSENWFQDFQNVLKLAHDKNIGVTTMKTLQGAQGAGAIKKGIDRKEAKLAAAKWSLNDANVDVAVISLSSISEINDFIEISGSAFNKKDRETLEALLSEQSHEVCRIGCPAPCISVCPSRVRIPDILRLEMYFTDYGCEKLAMQEYLAAGGGTRPAPCLSCPHNDCTKQCIYHIDVKSMLIEAHNHLAFS